MKTNIDATVEGRGSKVEGWNARRLSRHGGLWTLALGLWTSCTVFAQVPDAPAPVTPAATQPPASSTPASRPSQAPGVTPNSTFLGKDVPAFDPGNDMLQWDGKSWKVDN